MIYDTIVIFNKKCVSFAYYFRVHHKMRRVSLEMCRYLGLSSEIIKSFINKVKVKEKTLQKRNLLFEGGVINFIVLPSMIKDGSDFT